MTHCPSQRYDSGGLADQVMQSSSVTEGISEWVMRATLAVRDGVEAGVAAGMEAVRISSPRGTSR